MVMDWLVTLGLYLFDRVHNSPEAKGRRGEKWVSQALRRRLPQNDYVILDDLTIPSGNSTTQIDHLIISRFGVFVIETKNISGWIYGGEYERTWTQSFRSQRFAFQNPLRQNYLHAKTVEKALGLSGKEVHSVVAFVGDADPKSAFPRNVVWSIDQLIDFISHFKSECIQDISVEEFLRRLRALNLGGADSVKRQHKENVARAIEKRAKDQLSCPRCGAKMLERRNKKTGDAFLGCSRFPSCRGTRQIEFD